MFRPSGGLVVARHRAGVNTRCRDRSTTLTTRLPPTIRKAHKGESDAGERDLDNGPWMIHGLLPFSPSMTVGATGVASTAADAPRPPCRGRQVV